MTEQIENEIEFECDRCDCTEYQLINHEDSTYAQCLECGWQCPAIAIEEIKSCLNCRHLRTVWNGDGFNEPREADPECIHWDKVPDAILENGGWENSCSQHCGSFEAIATEWGAS